jgi:hypothetical protein
MGIMEAGGNQVEIPTEYLRDAILQLYYYNNLLIDGVNYYFALGDP